MTQSVIQVRDLSKCYQIRSTAPKPYHSLREDLVDGVKGFLRGQWGKSETEEFWALKDISFDVNQGEVVGIIGRNGAGKSTLLKILSRIVRPTSGEAIIRGRVGSLLEVGTGFHPELTGRENIFMNGAVLGMKRTEIYRKFDEIVAFAEVDKFLDTPVKFYSSGMYVRLAFAVAAHLEPEILIVDEVLAVGDIEFQKKCLGKMKGISSNGQTVLFVTHNLSAAKGLCEKSIYLAKGNVVSYGNSNTIIDLYLSSNQSSSFEKKIEGNNPSSKLHIKQIKFLNTKYGSFIVHWKQKIKILIQVDISEDINDVNFGVGITSFDGNPIITSHQNDNCCTSWNLKQGKYAIECTIRNELRPGKYYLSIGAHEKYVAKNLAFLPQIISFEVLEYTTDDKMYIPYNEGIINGYSHWHIKEFYTL